MYSGNNQTQVSDLGMTDMVELGNKKIAFGSKTLYLTLIVFHNNNGASCAN